MTGPLKSKKSANRNYSIVFADFVNIKIESANNLIFALFADFSKSVKLLPLSLKKKRGLSGNSGSPISWPKPRMAFKGVRSSWFILFINLAGTVTCGKYLIRDVRAERV